MESRHDQLRDELVALLGAGRELTEETDRQLADAFMHFLEQRQAPAVPVAKPGRTAQAERPDQPHYSLMAAGGAWGAALMFLFLLLLLDQPGPVDFLLVTVLILSVVAALTRAFLYMARYGWRAPRVTITPPSGTRQNRG